jgi:hypothetical protein
MCQFFICLEQGNPGAMACNFVHRHFQAFGLPSPCFSRCRSFPSLFLSTYKKAMKPFIHLQESYENFHPFIKNYETLHLHT